MFAVLYNHLKIRSVISLPEFEPFVSMEGAGPLLNTGFRKGLLYFCKCRGSLRYRYLAKIL